MGIFRKFFKKVGDKVSKKIEESNENKEKSEKLKKVQDEFTKAKSNYDTSGMDDREKIYLGTHEVDADVNSRKINPNGRKKANNVVNVVFELIESQIETTIPQPAVKAKRRGYEYQAQTIEDSTKNDLLESDIYRINDENERTTPIQGFSIITVDWNPDFEHHLYRGEIKIDNKHPKTLIPQPGIFNLQNMDYFFLMYSETKEFIKKRYDVDMPDEGEEYPEINSLSGDSDNNNDTDKLTIIIKWYKDKKGKIGKYVWCNDTELEDMPNFFARRLNDDETKKNKVEEYEELVSDIVRSDGTVIPAMSPELDEMGQPVTDEMGMPVLIPTKIKYFCPTRYPVIIRKNVPVSFYFGGQSDVDAIRDQADSIKKVVSTVEEKIIRGGVFIKAKSGHRFDLKNELYSVIRGEIDELAVLDIINLQANIQQDLEYAQQQYKSAQNTLGITDSFQGKPDKTAQSGVAKQIQVNQSSGRMQSKAFNKRNCFKELFEIMFEFKLAFYDETRPFMKVGQNGQPEYGEFNKYDFLEQDAAGEWYYNTDFLFSADAGEGIPKDKLWLMSQTQNFYSMGVLNKVQFWTSMENFGFPNSGEYKKQAQEEMQMMQQMQQQQMQMQQEQQQIQQQQQQEQSQAQQKQGEFDRQQKSIETLNKQQQQQFKQGFDVAKLIQDSNKMQAKGGG